MNWKIFLDKINAVEKSIEISKLRCFDFNPWPYIRLSVFNKWSLKNTDNIKKETDLNIKSGNIFFNFIKYFFSYIKNPIKDEEIDVVYFTNLPWFKETLDGKVFDKNADSFWHFFSKDYKIKNIEVSDYARENNKYYFSENVTYIYFFLLIARAKFKLKSYFTPGAPILHGDFNKGISGKFGFQVDVAAQLALINFMSKEFMKILPHYNPKIVFLAVFYCPTSMAISLACHRLGIRVVEYQHGAPNEYHAMYTHWENMPYNGYELIPDIFWTWGESSKEIVEDWSSKTTKHKAVIGGNLWMTYFKSKKANEDAGIELNYYQRGKVNILVSLQGDQFFPHFLFENIKNNSNEINWHFRNHPTLIISEGLKDKISSLPNAEIDFSSKASLYDLLNVTDIHVTSFSTVAFEAQNFNVATIFTHINALNGYKYLINKNGLYYADTSKKLDASINKILHSSEEIKPNNIVSDLEIHKNTLPMLLETS